MQDAEQSHPRIGSIIWTPEADYKGVTRGQIIPARRLRNGLYLVRYSRNGELNIRHKSAIFNTKDEAIKGLIAEIRQDLADLDASRTEEINKLKTKLKELEASQRTPS